MLRGLPEEEGVGVDFSTVKRTRVFKCEYCGLEFNNALARAGHRWGRPCRAQARANRLRAEGKIKLTDITDNIDMSNCKCSKCVSSGIGVNFNRVMEKLKEEGVHVECHSTDSYPGTRYGTGGFLMDEWVWKKDEDRIKDILLPLIL